jgi:hypothetical protein
VRPGGKAVVATVLVAVAVCVSVLHSTLPVLPRSFLSECSAPAKRPMKVVIRRRRARPAPMSNFSSELRGRDGLVRDFHGERESLRGVSPLLRSEASSVRSAVANQGHTFVRGWTWFSHVVRRTVLETRLMSMIVLATGWWKGNSIIVGARRTRPRVLTG